MMLVVRVVDSVPSVLETVSVQPAPSVSVTRGTAGTRHAVAAVSVPRVPHVWLAAAAVTVANAVQFSKLLNSL